ncbi:hypothetical protein DNU06_03925 [Putridiphycobacter roseus]|uniref:DUF4783 domain-containing protein n=1 Tax=Putridiphycobacter roseus TaxID=2219161 RepID=A0A2W1NEC7_9FLAO|nr:hypothetical protein [Putridiphycobacter roseus]PZE17775.1 hypothetical protein DNU06_03925 [Putridiphycobacter roseus]
MKKIHFLGFVLFFLSSCASSVVFTGDSEISKKNIIKFSTHLETVVEQHQMPHFIDHVEPNYKAEQLVGMMENDSVRFVNEFFCGNSTEDQFICPDFDKIISMDLTEIKQESSGIYKLTYKIVNTMGILLNVEVFLNTKQEKYTLYSAVG